MTFLFYQTVFVKTLWSSILINVPLFYLTLRMKFKQIENSKEEKVLGITFDNKLEFTTHLTSITKKANTKLNALNRVQITKLQNKRSS